jgi:hypothetical protein
MLTQVQSSPRLYDGNFTQVQLKYLYNIKTQLMMCDPHGEASMIRATTIVQRLVRRRRIIKEVLAVLETRSHYHPAVLAMDQNLQAHGLGRFAQALIDDDHDVFTILQCSPGDLKMVYGIPMGAAVRLLQDLHPKFKHAPDEVSVAMRHRTPNHTIAKHVANGVLLLLEVSTPDQFVLTQTNGQLTGFVSYTMTQSAGCSYIYCPGKTFRPACSLEMDTRTRLRPCAPVRLLQCRPGLLHVVYCLYHNIS